MRYSTKLKLAQEYLFLTDMLAGSKLAEVLIIHPLPRWSGRIFFRRVLNSCHSNICHSRDGHVLLSPCHGNIRHSCDGHVLPCHCDNRRSNTGHVLRLCLANDPNSIRQEIQALSPLQLSTLSFSSFPYPLLCFAVLLGSYPQ